MPHRKHDAVRERFGGCCGYCTVSDTDSGGELTIDHFIPISAGGDDSDENLVYCCFRCNTFKGEFAPTPEDLLRGFRVLHPFLDKTSDYYFEDRESGLLVPSNETGRFHISLLQLNRVSLVEYRSMRRLMAIQLETIRLLESRNELLRGQIESLENYIRMLHNSKLRE